MAGFDTILLTGTNGQVGRELMRVLQGQEALGSGKVVALDRQRLDLADADAIRRVIRDIKPDLIVNPAAYTAVDLAETEPERAHAINAVAPGIMAEEAARLGAVMVHYSTDYVYDGSKSAPYVEDDQTNPLSVYGKSKLAGEEAIRASDIPHLILRTSWVYGARGKNFMKTMIRLATERDALHVVADQFGAPTSSLTIADATAQALAAWDEQPSGTYHLTCSGSTSWHGFAQAILAHYAAMQAEMQEASQWPRLKVQAEAVAAITTADYPTSAVRPANSRLDCGKFVQAFDVPLPTWQQALARVMQELRAVGLSAN